MNTKEAVQKVKDKYEGWQGYARSQKEVDELGKERDEVIELLKCGDKYKAIIKGLKQYCLILEKHNILKEITRLEQK